MPQAILKFQLACDGAKLYDALWSIKERFLRARHDGAQMTAETAVAWILEELNEAGVDLDA